MTPCPRCRGMTFGRAFWCPACGLEGIDYLPDREPPRPQPDAHAWVCRLCGFETPLRKLALLHAREAHQKPGEQLAMLEVGA